MLKVVLAAGICLGVGACASMNGRNVNLAMSPGNQVDTEKIDKVTEWAHNHGATVIWLHYPVKTRPRPTPAGS